MTYNIQELTPALLQTNLDDYFATLANLTTIEHLSVDEAIQILAKINQQGTHIYVAIHDDGHIVGTISLMLEQKFLRG